MSTHKGESDQTLIILKEMFNESTKEGVLDSIAALQKRNEAVHSFLTVDIAQNRK